MMDFLHRVYELGIIHRDIKDSNILLDANFVAKIADFGLAKLVKTSNESQTTIVSSTGVKGTFGYLDPEYFYTQRMSKKTDVYAFGVLLLVVLCGRPAVNNKSSEDQRSLAEWANKCIQKNRVDEIIDPHLAGKISSMSLKLFVKLSQKCLLRQSEKRPTMEEVVSGLELVLKKQPEFYGTTSRQQNGRSSLTQMVAKLQMVFTQKQSGKEIFVPSNLCPKISLDEIKTATKNFSDKLIIGQGCVWIVYKGRLNNGSEVAIKKISASREGVLVTQREFITLCTLKHDHVVPLKGYCHESSGLILVYEYLSKGSLDRHLYERRDNKQACLTWEQRLSICIGAARGFDFIHRVSEPSIIHGDVKCSKILLDDNFVSKVSIFGLSKLDDDDNTSKRAMGYLSPEYVFGGSVTTKSDVYGFGVLLLVVLSADEGHEKFGNGWELLEFWAMKCIKENKIDQIIDPYLNGHIKSESLEQFLKIALQCLHRQPEQRPTMEEVIPGLELALLCQHNSTLTQWVESHELRLLLENMESSEMRSKYWPYWGYESDEDDYLKAHSNEAVCSQTEYSDEGECSETEYSNDGAQDFIHKCLQVDPDIRPSAAELLEHSFVKRPHSSSASASPDHHGMHA